MVKLLDHPLATGIAPPWASAWGEDAFGVFAVLRVGDAEQKLRYIPPGSFLMGSPDDEEGRWSDEGPQHRAALAEGFWLAETPCAQDLWNEVMGENPSEFKGPRRPVDSVSWDEARSFLQRLSERVAGLEARLPTEAQWEYACRAGTIASTYAGSGQTLGDLAWYFENSGHSTQDVGLKLPNRLGLYDMLGNVWEWCADYWSNGYEADDQRDPVGPAMGSSRVIRGGSWAGGAGIVRAAFRNWLDPGVRDGDLGFRFSLGRPRSG